MKYNPLKPSDLDLFFQFHQRSNAISRGGRGNQLIAVRFGFATKPVSISINRKTVYIQFYVLLRIYPCFEEVCLELCFSCIITRQ